MVANTWRHVISSTPGAREAGQSTGSIWEKSSASGVGGGVVRADDKAGGVGGGVVRADDNAGGVTSPAGDGSAGANGGDGKNNGVPGLGVPILGDPGAARGGELQGESFTKNGRIVSSCSHSWVTLALCVTSLCKSVPSSLDTVASAVASIAEASSQAVLLTPWAAYSSAKRSCSRCCISSTLNCTPAKSSYSRAQF